MSSLPSSPRSPRSPNISSLLAGSSSEGASEAEASSLLGQRLVKAEWLSQVQLTQALREQQQNRLRLGEICLEHGWVSPEVLYSQVSSHMILLGELLIASKDITFDQLRVVLAQQRRFGRQLGEILVWKGWISPERLGQMLEVQQRLRATPDYPAWEVLQAVASGELLEDLLSSPSEESIEITEERVSEDLDIQRAAGEILDDLSEMLATDSEPKIDHPIESEDSQPEPPLNLLDPQQRRILELEQLLRQREQDWEGVLSEMNGQIEGYQQQYLERIAKLEAKIREQHQHLKQAQQAQSQDRQTTPPTPPDSTEEIERLTLELTSTQAQLHQHQHQHQQERSQLQAQIHALQQALQEFSDQAEAHTSLPQHQEGEPNPEIESLHQQILQLHTELQEAYNRIQLLEAEAGEAQTTLAQLQQELEQAHTHSSQDRDVAQEVTLLQQTLLETQQTQQHYEDLIDKQQTQLEVSQTHGSRLAQDLAESRRQLLDATHELHAKQAQADQANQQIATLKLQISRLEQQEATLTQELEQTWALLETYRQHFTALQPGFQIQQGSQTISLETTYNSTVPSPPSDDSSHGLLEPETSAQSPVAATASNVPPEEQSPSLMPVLTPWAQNLFFQLQEAGLISDTEMDRVLLAWQQEGGKLTQVLSRHTGLTPQTVSFFGGNGYAALLSPGHTRIGDFLKAADLVTEEQILEAIQRRSPEQPLVEALVDQGLLDPVTADYFIRHFIHSI